MITIERADITACQTIHDMAEVVFRDTYKEILSPDQMEYMMNWMYSLDSLRKQMEDGHVYFIARCDGEPCGYLSVEQQEADIFHLQKIYVMPQYQGLKLGKRLFEKAIEYIKSVHPAPCLMELNVNRNNKALHFYERMGMRKLREGSFPIGNDYYMCDYIMGMDI